MALASPPGKNTNRPLATAAWKPEGAPTFLGSNLCPFLLFFQACLGLFSVDINCGHQPRATVTSHDLLAPVAQFTGYFKAD